ncbi:MAG: metal-dependent hydrolase [Gemmatimonadetes bacterium]|nr:metal-dependent hydrolase [Gemmatimonadota bacterium]|tara:strand:+ start:10938 stop:11618 length:681 start_codon:yes stop_codon:yes gene_type:complete
MPKLTFHGHATVSIHTADSKLVIDPFFSDNPHFVGSVDDIEADYILVTHGHYDHVADLIGLAERTGATCIATFEIASFLESQGLNTSPQHIGGGAHYPFGYVKLTAALHGGMVNLPGAEGFTTLPAGILINFNSGERFYHAGDTALLTDMQLLKGKVDVAVLPIGDRFTMGPDDAVTAVEFIEPKVVIPCHYDTWPPIEQDAAAFAAKVGDRAKVQVMAPGDILDF